MSEPDRHTGNCLREIGSNDGQLREMTDSHCRDWTASFMMLR